MDGASVFRRPARAGRLSVSEGRSCPPARLVLRRQIRRSELLASFKALPPCVIGMEACTSAPYWARELRALGHTVRLMPATYVKPCAKRGKSDATDANPICEAVTLPTMRFPPIKSTEQQALVTLHRTPELLVRQRTMLVNALRGHLAEFWGDRREGHLPIAGPARI
jgi:transposase